MKKTSIGNIVFGWILPILSYILFFTSLYLIKLVDDRMGLQRDLFVRNKKLFTSVLSPELVVIYKIILVVGTFISIYFVFKKYYYGIFSASVSIVTFVMLFFLESADTLAFPWIVISLLISSVIQYLKMIQYILTNKR